MFLNFYVAFYFGNIGEDYRNKNRVVQTKLLGAALENGVLFVDYPNR